MAHVIVDPPGLADLDYAPDPDEVTWSLVPTPIEGALLRLGMPIPCPACHQLVMPDRHGWVVAHQPYPSHCSRGGWVVW